MPGTTRPEAEPPPALRDGGGLRRSSGPGCGCVLGRGGRRSQGYPHTGGDLEVSAFSPSWLPVSGRGVGDITALWNCPSLDLRGPCLHLEAWLGCPLPVGVCCPPLLPPRRVGVLASFWSVHPAASPAHPRRCHLWPSAPKRHKQTLERRWRFLGRGRWGGSQLGPQVCLLNCWWGSRQPGRCLLGRAALRAACPGHSGRFRDAGQSALGRRG